MLVTSIFVDNRNGEEETTPSQCFLANGACQLCQKINNKKLEEEEKCQSFMNLLGLARPVFKTGLLDTDVNTPCGCNASVFQGAFSQ